MKRGHGNHVFTNKNYSIYRCSSRGNVSYIVHNRNREFSEAHTHLNNFKLAKLVIYTCLTGCPPEGKERLLGNHYFVESIVRVCTNQHRRKFNELYESMKKTKSEILPAG